MSDRLRVGAGEGESLPSTSRQSVSWASRPETYETGELDVRDVWRALRRNGGVIALTTLLIVGLVAAWTFWVTPVWSAHALVRVEEQESGLLAAPALTALTGLGGGSSQIETELRVLRTRPIVEQVVDELDLNLVVVDPKHVPRSLLFDEIELGRSTIEAAFQIRPIASGGYRITGTRDEGLPVRVDFRPGERVEIPGGWFALADLANAVDADGVPLPTAIEFETAPFQEAVKELSEDMSASRPDREANILSVGYRTTDRILAYQVPNAISAAFIARRNATDRLDARSTVEFIQVQVDSTRAQLRAVEDSLREFQETEQIVSVEAEAEAQVERLAGLQGQRTQIDAERAALARLLEDIDAGAAVRADYRRLASFPTFFRNDAVGTILTSLIQADSARHALLARATPQHPDVIAVEERIEQLEEQLGSIGRNYRQSLGDQISVLDEEITRFRSELEMLPERQITLLRIRRQVETLGELYRILQTRLKEAQVQEEIDDSSVRVVEEAIVPLEPLSPNPGRNLALAVVLGLVAGLLVAFVREYTDGRLHADDSLEALYSLPTMARIPLRDTSDRDGGRRLPIVLAEAQSVEAESYRTLRTNIAMISRLRSGLKVLVSSPSPGEGKSLTAANLAVTLAQQGRPTLLLDADMRRPVLHLKFDAPQAPGLSDCLLADELIEGAICPTMLESLFVLPAGRPPPNPAELLDSAQMDRLLETLRSRYDAVIMDSPPVLAVTDSAVLAPKTDGVILVVRAEKTDRDAIALAIQQMRQVGAEILGIVVNDAKAEGAYQAYHEYYGEARPTGFAGLIERVKGAFS